MLYYNNKWVILTYPTKGGGGGWCFEVYRHYAKPSELVVERNNVTLKMLRSGDFSLCVGKARGHLPASTDISEHLN
jgi:hypothetical protein